MRFLPTPLAMVVYTVPGINKAPAKHNISEGVLPVFLAPCVTDGLPFPASVVDVNAGITGTHMTDT